MRITGRKEVSYEKKQRNRRWFSLLLGICLLVSMQLSAFAESQSAEGIPEAVTTGSGQLQEQSGKAEEQSAGNGQIQAEERSAGNGQIQAEERSAGNGQIQAEEQTAENRQTMAEQQERAVSGKIEAKVYLRYSNEVPSAINNAFAMGEFGPSGNDKPYFTVTVDLDELNKKVNSYSYWQDYGRGNWVEYIYYSIDSDARWNQQNTRLESVTKLWREAITSAMSAADQAKFTNVFGENMFVCGDGIRVLDAAGIEQAAARYDRAKESLRVVKFVPASGAATRMFKDLFEFVREGRRTAVVGELLANRRRFAFWPELRTIIGDDADELRTVENIVAEGLRYGETPKGLVSFHRYGDEVRKAVEEHLVEGAQYAAAGGEVKIHFTVSPEHLTRFEALLAEKIPGYESRFGVKYRISFSVQDPSTDTLAVNPDCTPFRRADGRLLFRPAGHGALIGNLGKIDADIVFVKNIDNVTTDARRSDTVLYKKALAGVLLALQERIFEYLICRG